MIDVCLLGTGGMMPLPYRYLTSLMLRYNGKGIMVDCGEGTQVALRKKGWSPKPIDLMLFTHYHADHISGLPGMLLTMGNAERTEPLLMIGPKGLSRVVNSLRVPEDQQVRWSGERVEEVKIEEVTTAEVTPGMWTSDFVAATNAAEAAHLPVVVYALLPGCPYCIHFYQQVQSEEVKAWQKKLGWYFVLTSAEKTPESLTLVKTKPVRNKKPPFVGVYWRRADGTCAMRNFTAKSGHMGVPAEPSLAREWMHAVEASVPGAPGVSSVPKSDVGVQIAVGIEMMGVRKGPGRMMPPMGRVSMSPSVKVIHAGEKVVLTAEPRKGAEFVGWRYPDGQVVQGGPQLTLDDTCQAGRYRAIFRRRKGKGKGGELKRAEEGK